MFLEILHWFSTDAAEKQNSHDLNTVYTCDRYQQVQFLIDVGFGI
ncbi:hypothetical protein T06_10495 [Trichinella sp. T6]|nr:hypothetical protein T06_10495 [Trichinella sp. T6]